MYFLWTSFVGAVPPPSQEPVVLRPFGCGPALLKALSELSIAELECAWLCTDVELAGGTDKRRRGALVGLRGLILDELERRSTRRYRAWLRRGGPRPRASNSDLVVVA
jgi:hypothetical protein